MSIFENVLFDSSEKPLASKKKKSHPHARIQWFPGEECAASFLCHQFFARPLKRKECLMLCGCSYSSTRIMLGTDNQSLYFEYFDQKKGIIGVAFLSQSLEQEQTFELNNEWVRFLLRKNIFEQKLRWFLNQKLISERLEISEIRLTACKTSMTSGYCFFPEFGFDAMIPKTLVPLLPDKLDHCQTLLDLYETELGKGWWSTHGCPINMKFSLEPGSRSQHVFCQVNNASRWK